VPSLTADLVDPGGARVGLLGGSFNPAHAGHLELSRLAIRKLRLDQVWWLVSPQNPLKSEQGMAPQQRRIAAAEKVADDARINVTGIETELGTRYTADTLAALRETFPKARFVWLMGADNLLQIHKWRDWSRIFHTVPVAVFARPTYSSRAEQSIAAKRFARSRIPSYKAARLADKKPPAWVLFKRPLNPLSATQIRRQERSR